MTWEEIDSVLGCKSRQASNLYHKLKKLHPENPNTLKYDLNEVIRLREIDGLLWREIAEILSVSEKKIASFYHRSHNSTNIKPKANIKPRINKCKVCGEEIPQGEGSYCKKSCQDFDKMRFPNRKKIGKIAEKVVERAENVLAKVIPDSTAEMIITPVLESSKNVKETITGVMLAMLGIKEEEEIKE